MLTQEQQTNLKNQLLEEKKTIEQSLHNFNEGQHDSSIIETTGELSLYDNHPGDVATELYEREKDAALEEHAEEDFEKVQLALKAMEDGTYGVCKKCNEPIPYERLEIIPTTLYCVKHSPEQDVKDYRPVEEKILEAPRNGSFSHSRAEVRDTQDSFQEVARFGTSESPSDRMGDHESYSDLYREEEGFVEEVDKYGTNRLDGKREDNDN